MAVLEVPEELNLAAVHEAIAAAIPDRECIVWRDRRLTWAEVTDRTRRFASLLADAGLGAHRRLDECEPWESPHDHVALYLHNGNEYLEGLLGAAKARCAGVNVNYRYVAEELRYVLADSAAAAIVYHGAFAATLAEVLPSLPHLRLLLQVDDGSGTPLLPGAVDYEAALATATPAAPTDLSPDDLYVLYTGGTTGHAQGRPVAPGRLPRRLPRRRPDHRGARGCRRGTARCRALPAPPFMHGAAHWNALSAWVAGGTVVIQDDPVRLDPVDVLDTVEPANRSPRSSSSVTPSPVRSSTRCAADTTRCPACASSSRAGPSCRPPSRTSCSSSCRSCGSSTCSARRRPAVRACTAPTGAGAPPQAPSTAPPPRSSSPRTCPAGSSPATPSSGG